MIEIKENAIKLLNCHCVDRHCSGGKCVAWVWIDKEYGYCSTLPIKKTTRKAKNFSPPKIDDVKNYIYDIGYESNVNAQRFIDYYESNGWMVGKNKMKNWKAAARNWVKSSNYWTTKDEYTQEGI